MKSQNDDARSSDLIWKNFSVKNYKYTPIRFISYFLNLWQATSTYICICDLAYVMQQLHGQINNSSVKLNIDVLTIWCFGQRFAWKRSCRCEILWCWVWVVCGRPFRSKPIKSPWFCKPMIHYYHFIVYNTTLAELWDRIDLGMGLWWFSDFIVCQIWNIGICIVQRAWSFLLSC